MLQTIALFRDLHSILYFYKMFAIIDIETCAGKFEFRKGRITEICILKHDGLSVIESFTTLVNPECNISPYFIGLTGITNEMVADAPKFHEIAPKIIEMTEGCVFVAHNVSFDYNFIREEFNSLGYKYKRETLCTVRLSRKLIPGRISYSLGHLCASLGIEIFGRHRAEGDAVATAQLFDLLMQLKTQDPTFKNVGVEEIMVRKVDKIKKYILDKLPEECGVYYFLNKDKEIIYIGKSNNAYNRALSHFNTESGKNKKMLFELMNVDFVPTGSELVALLLESEEIKNHKPKYNRMRKSSEFTHHIVFFRDKNKILNLKISASSDNEIEPILLSFNSYSAAREKIEFWIDEFELCLQFCGLTSENAICFNHQIKKCKGICAGDEAIEEYNARVECVLKTNQFACENFLIIDKGRNNNEHAVIHVENFRYKGFGYMDIQTSISSIEEILNEIKTKNYYPDCDMLIKNYVKQGKGKVIELNSLIQPNADF